MVCDQLQPRDIFVLAARRQQQDAAIGRIRLLARHDAIRPAHAPALDAAVERELDADEAQHVVVLLCLDCRDALLDVGLAQGAIEHVGAHRHLARVLHRAVERHLPLVDARLDDADDAVGIEIAHRNLEELRHVGRRRRENPAHQIGGGLEQHAGRLAVGVAHDDAAVRVRRVLGDAGKLQRLRVHRDDVAAARDEHRIVGRDPIELVAGRHPPLFQDALVPAGRGHHPLARLGARDAFGNGVLHVDDGARAEKLHGRTVQPREQLMQVGIDQAGHDCLARKLDHLRVRADVGSDRRIGADCEKAPIPYGDGLRDAPVLVDRNDPAAAQHEIGGLGEG